MSIPEPIQKAMARWSNDYSGHIEYLGEYQGKGAYCYHFDEPVNIGFPVVYLLNSDGKVDEIDAPKSFEIINSLVNDDDEIVVE